MPEPETVFLVNADDDPIQLIIKGRACFQNARPVSQFFARMMDQNHPHFVVDFGACTGMDSTFLGILAGAGIHLMELSPPGRMVLTRLSDRNRDLVENLGLDQIVEIDRGRVPPLTEEGAQSLKPADKTSANENARMVLRAHENLVQIDGSNYPKFQDVIEFLRNQVDE